MHDSNRENISKLTEGELAAIADAHPYYALAQWWLLSSYKNTGHMNFHGQAGRVSLFFNNHKWLNWQLSGSGKIYRKNDIIITASDPVTPIPVISIPVPSVPDPEKLPAISLDKSEDVIAFEPLYTVDYFASQGIKISEEVLTHDKLGTQLKSFTEWLKSMKKIHVEKLAGGDEQSDSVIQHLAENSNANIPVITEAMAEVLLKQGKIEQAIEIYNKLSLTNPSGSAYFAVKINSLKPI